MTRLTNTIKQDIRSVVEQRCITDKEAALQARIDEFCKTVFWQQLTKYEFQIWKSLPAILKPNYVIGRIHISDSALGSLMSNYLNDAYPIQLNNRLKYADLNVTQRKQFKQIMREQDDHEEYVKQVRDNLNSVLSSVTTVKKLREVWVNGAEIIDKALGMSQQSPTVYMPMVAVDQLDILIPLP